MKKIIYPISILFTFIVLTGCSTKEHEKREKIDKLAQAYFDYKKYNGMVCVAEDGHIILQKGYGMANYEWNQPCTPTTRFRIASISKTFTAILIMQQVEKGKISLDQHITDFLPWYRKDIGDQVTIKQLLTHSSGIPNYLTIAGVRNAFLRAPMTSLQKFIEDWCSRDLEFSPGDHFSYNNSGYAILAAIIEKSTGMKYSEALKKNIFDPLDMTNSGCERPEDIIPFRAAGYQRLFDGGLINAPWVDMSWAIGAGDIYSTTEDLVKYDQGLQHGKLLKPETLAIMIKPQYPAFGQYYGLGWMLSNIGVTPKGDSLWKISHEGGISGFNLYFLRIPTKNQVVILLNNTSDAPLKEMAEKMIFILNDMNYTMPKRSLAMEIYPVIMKDGIQKAMALYHDKKKNDTAGYMVTESDMNKLGYELLGKNKLDAAEVIFAENINLYPKSFNVYDSMADLWEAKKDTVKAIEYSKKSLEIDPSNSYSTARIERLSKHSL